MTWADPAVVDDRCAVISFKRNRHVARTPDVELWRLTKDRRSLVCSERMTPLGPEIRLMLDGDLLRSDLCRPPKDAQELAREWRIESTQKGWQ